jgi:murein DD-endopeptidase MepM/ murein hydrolase activator NlpD
VTRVAVTVVLLLTVAGAPAYPGTQTAAAAPAPSPSPSVPEWQRPVPDAPAGALLRPFVPPVHRYAAGHRGVDLHAAPGSAVSSPADGVVVFTGEVARVPVVVVAHPGGYRSALLPVDATLPPGSAVAAGGVLGRSSSGPGSGPEGRAHCPVPCVHWGVREHGEYVDPLGLLRPRVILLPSSRGGVVAASGRSAPGSPPERPPVSPRQPPA